MGFETKEKGRFVRLKKMDDASFSDRRNFLRRSVTLIHTVSVLGVAGVGVAQARGTPPAAPMLAYTAPYRPIYFNAPEWGFLQAAVARLIPSDETGPGALEAGVPEFIDRQMEGPFGWAATWYMQGPFLGASPLFGYQKKMLPREVYRAGIAATDAYCRQTFDGKSFLQLTPEHQDAVLKGMEAGTLVFKEVGAKDFFAFLLQNTKEGYFSDPIHGGNKNAAAWKMIGFPGARADFADWVGRPGVVYTLPPVSINGLQDVGPD